jgi:hypothetical protein
MKNYDLCLNQGETWNEFEVVARNCHHIVQFENRSQGNKVRHISVHTLHNASIPRMDAGQILDYTTMEDDLTHMEDFRVTRNNERFGFTVDNPSDEVYKKTGNGEW